MFYHKIWRDEFGEAYKKRGDTPAAARRRTAESLLRLRKALDWTPEAADPSDRGIPPKRFDTLLLATWNIREFESAKYGFRLEESYYYIAEIISRFDLVAVQEVREDLDPVRKLLKIMGEWWDMLATDVTLGKRGNGERMVFLYDTRKVTFDGMAGELVIPPKDVTLPDGTKVKAQPAEQLYRTPYICTFSARWRRLMLATVHILYGEAVADNPLRIKEIETVAKFMRDLDKQETSRRYDTVILGDFNIFDPEDETLAAIKKAGFRIPKELQGVPGTNVQKNKFYDQIAFRRIKDELDTTGNAGVFDLFRYLYRDPSGSDADDMEAYSPAMGPALHTTSSGKPRANPRTYYKQWRTFQMSDHLPMWIELKTNFADEYISEKSGLPIP